MPIEPGAKIGPYEIETAIGAGGMSTLFRARDTRTGVTVAIKIADPEMQADPVYFDRFQREKEIGKRLEHPSVVRVFEEDGKQQPYLAMEWAEGRPLRKVLAENGKLPPERAVRISVRILAALAYVHSQGVVHRDLKPENIMVDENDQIKLLDFGIAFHKGARRLTFGRFSHISGTADYISPEQANGKRGDARIDLYAMGVILYEMLTGALPFRGDNPFVAIHERLLNHPIPPREANPEISPQLQEVLYRALEREPRNRYEHAREFARDLEHLDEVGVEDREELRWWKDRREPSGKSAQTLVYAMLALVPVSILVTLLLFATHHR